MAQVTLLFLEAVLISEELLDTKRIHMEKHWYLCQLRTQKGTENSMKEIGQCFSKAWEDIRRLLSLLQENSCVRNSAAFFTL